MGGRTEGHLGASAGLGARARRSITAVAALGVLAATMGMVVAPVAGATVRTPKWTPTHQPHFIRPQFIATSPHYFPLDVPSATSPTTHIASLVVSKSGHVTGGRAMPAATPLVIPTGTTFAVTSTADVGLATPASTACAATVTGATKCTLRAAVEAADNLGAHKATTAPAPRAATITLQAGTYSLTAGALDVVNAAGVTINGQGPGATVLASNGSGRVIAMDQGKSAVPGSDLALNGLTLSGGHAAPTTTTGCGGGIYQPRPVSVLELNGVAVTANTAARAGGGICANGTVYASATSITGNTVAPVSTGSIDALGGGMVLGFGIAGAAYFNGVTITGNTVDTSGIATTENWFGAGGGLAALYGSAAHIMNSALNGNTVTSASTTCATPTTTKHICGVLAGGGLFTEVSNVEASTTTFDTNTVDQTGSCASHSSYCEFGAIGGGTANFGGTALTHVTVAGNRVSTGVPGSATMNTAEGGGIDTYSPMTLTDSTVSGNTAVGANDATDSCTLSGGAGIFAGSPGFVMTGTTVSDNTLWDGAGAGVIVWSPDSYVGVAPIQSYSSGDTLTDDVISGNQSKSSWTYATNQHPYDFGAAGGLFVETGSVQLTGLTIRGNTATGWGGGLWISRTTTANVGAVTVADNTAYQGGGVMLTWGATFAAVNSTIAGNAATGTVGSTYDTGFNPGGGGIYAADGSVAALTYDTVSANTSATTGGGYFNHGGGATTVGTILAGNLAGGLEQDCAATGTDGVAVASGGWNLAGDASCGLAQPTDQVSVDPMLGSLADNGGPAPTMVPNVGSPAIDAGGGAPTCPATDERGIARPQGRACDVGAVEVSAGYWAAGADGGVFALGGAPFFGSAVGQNLSSPVVGMAVTPNAGGYWLATSAGAVAPFGNAASYGSMAGRTLNQPVVGIAATPDGKGYWLVASDGGIFCFGDAGYFGSMGGQPLNRPIVGIAATPDGGGYWLVASDGGVFAFGDAPFHGSAGSLQLNKPVVGIAATPDGGGYWLVASDGGVFAFGDAPFHGSMGGQPLNKPIVGMAATGDAGGYWLVASDGGIFALGDAPFEGSLPSNNVAVGDVVAVATA